MDSEKTPSGPSWSVVVMVMGPEDKTVVRFLAPEGSSSFWELPNGENIEEDKQSPHRTASRILKERTGLEVNASEFQLTTKRYMLKEGKTHLVYLFLVSVCSYFKLQQKKSYRNKENKDGRLKLVDFKTVSKMPDLLRAHQGLINKLCEEANHITVVHPNSG